MFCALAPIIQYIMDICKMLILIYFIGALFLYYKHATFYLLELFY